MAVSRLLSGKAKPSKEFLDCYKKVSDRYFEYLLEASDAN